MKRFAYLKKDHINKYFCHELFQQVFTMFNYEEIKQASLVCHLWNEHIEQMRNTLFRRYYDALGGDSSQRLSKVSDWEKEVKDILSTCKLDVVLFKYSQQVGDDCLRDSVVEDGGLVMDVCKYLLEVGGKVPIADLLIHFQRQVASQSQKSEIIDILDFMCDTLTCVDGDESDDEEVVTVCLKEFLENGKFIKDVRMIFLQNEGQVESQKVYEWIGNHCTERKYSDSIKKEIHEFFEVISERVDDDFSSFFMLRKIYSTKRLM